jgi:hypothetical protein
VLNRIPASRHPSGWATQTWLSRTARPISCPRQDARLRCTQRTIAELAGTGAQLGVVEGALELEDVVRHRAILAEIEQHRKGSARKGAFPRKRGHGSKELDPGPRA